MRPAASPSASDGPANLLLVKTDDSQIGKSAVDIIQQLRNCTYEEFRNESWDGTTFIGTTFESGKTATTRVYINPAVLAIAGSDVSPKSDLEASLRAVFAFQENIIARMAAPAAKVAE